MAQRRDRRVAVRNHDEAREFTSGRRIPDGSGLSDYALPANVDQPRGGIAFPGDTIQPTWPLGVLCTATQPALRQMDNAIERHGSFRSPGGADRSVAGTARASMRNHAASGDGRGLRGCAESAQPDTLGAPD